MAAVAPAPPSPPPLKSITSGQALGEMPPTRLDRSLSASENGLATKEKQSAAKVVVAASEGYGRYARSPVAAGAGYRTHR